MNNEYFRDKVLKLLPMFHNLAIILVGEDEPNIVDILKQIARDAADEQRINCSAACALRMKGRVDANCKCGEIYCTAKLEIPHA